MVTLVQGEVATAEESESSTGSGTRRRVRNKGQWPKKRVVKIEKAVKEVLKFLAADKELVMNDRDFLAICQGGNSHNFTRNRVMPLPVLLAFLFMRNGETLGREIPVTMKKLEKPEITASGFCQQRDKLDPYALYYLIQHHCKNVYSESQILSTLNGYRVFAIDGSSLNVPTTKDTIKAYGNASNVGTKDCAQLGLSCLYDVLNKIIIDVSIHKHKFDEIEAAEKHLPKIKEIVGTDERIVVTLDRNYIKLAFFLRMIDQGKFFIVRLKKTDFHDETKDFPDDFDEDVEIKLTTPRRYNYRGTPDEEIMASRDSFTLRVVTVLDEKGSVTRLATNLPRDEFPKESFYNLYHMRWGIETVYNTLKNAFYVENFTGTKPKFIEQEIYSAIYVCNIAHDFIRAIEYDNKEELEHRYIHKKQINITICIGALKDDLIKVVLEENPEKKGALFDELCQAIYKHLVDTPDPKRNRPRDPTPPVGSKYYSKTKKRSF